MENQKCLVYEMIMERIAGNFLETLYSSAGSDLQACKFYFQTLQSHDPKPIDMDIFMDLPYFFQTVMFRLFMRLGFQITGSTYIRGNYIIKNTLV